VVHPTRMLGILGCFISRGGRVGVVSDAMPGLACWIGGRAAVDGDLHARGIAAGES
jgi:hypothetical protein